MDNRKDFIAAAILDTQATIRSIDVKVAALLVAVLTPLANTNRVFGHLSHFGTMSPKWLFLTLAITFLGAWIAAFTALVRSIGAIDNPATHIINSGSLTGSFYSGGLYKMGLLDVFLNRDLIKASKDPVSFLAAIPNDAASIEKELAFEHMKLVYIRETKLNRLNWGLKFSLIWLVLGIGIFLSSKYLF